MNQRDRKLVPTTVSQLYVDCSVDSLIRRLVEIKQEYGGDSTIELYTEYYGGNEGSPAVRVRKMLPESDDVYQRRMKWLDEAEARQRIADEEAYERIKAQRLAEGKQV